jgi:drug/metabolite transporter (DMT)-like permease
MTFAEKQYGTRNVSSASIETQTRRRWPGISMMVIGAAILTVGYATDAFQMMLMGAAAFMGGSMYFSRRKPTYGLRLNTSSGPVFVVASRNKSFLLQLKEAVDRSIDASQASG